MGYTHMLAAGMPVALVKLDWKITVDSEILESLLQLSIPTMPSFLCSPS
jgi:hypothetical protein